MSKERCRKNGRSILKRVGKRYFRIDPGKAVLMKFELSEERGGDRQRMSCGTDVVNKIRQR